MGEARGWAGSPRWSRRRWDGIAYPKSYPPRTHRREAHPYRHSRNHAYINTLYGAGVIEIESTFSAWEADDWVQVRQQLYPELERRADGRAAGFGRGHRWLAMLELGKVGALKGDSEKGERFGH